jgi:hypothetical protein
VSLLSFIPSVLAVERCAQSDASVHVCLLLEVTLLQHMPGPRLTDGCAHSIRVCYGWYGKTHGDSVCLLSGYEVAFWGLELQSVRDLVRVSSLRGQASREGVVCGVEGEFWFELELRLALGIQALGVVCAGVLRDLEASEVSHLPLGFHLASDTRG